ncbi:MAG: DUF1806 family protein [Clostridia bacterium]|nr:DUF1806 family protein [Clostridia bacterium]
MQPIEPETAATVRELLNARAGQRLYLHLETTRGAYTQGGFGAFARNVTICFQRAGVAGGGPYRVGLQLDGGWVFAEGLTHWEEDPQGRLLLAGYDAEGNLTVALELSRTPFPLE